MNDHFEVSHEAETAGSDVHDTGLGNTLSWHSGRPLEYHIVAVTRQACAALIVRAVNPTQQSVLNTMKYRKICLRCGDSQS